MLAFPLRALLILLALSLPLAAEGKLQRLKQLWSEKRWADAEQLARQAIAEQPEPTDLESLAAFPEGYEMLRQADWPEIQAAYFARLDAAMAARPQDIPYEFHCRGIKEQWARSLVTATAGDFAPVTALDEANTARLKVIVAEQGWPRKSTWGVRPALAAWLILQHTPDAEFRREMLPALEKAYAEKELDGPYYALTYDRVQRYLGRPQRYGSQLARAPGGGWMAAEPLEDAEHLDQLRASVGLNPIAEYLRDSERILPTNVKHGWFR